MILIVKAEELEAVRFVDTFDCFVKNQCFSFRDCNLVAKWLALWDAKSYLSSLGGDVV